MNRTLDLVSLRTLITVAETGGMTRAANRLHMTQSAVSMQMKRLEEQLSIQLLTREGRKVVPTREGANLISYGKRLLEINDEAIRSLKVPLFDVSINLGVPVDIVHPFMPRVLDRFRQVQPRCRVNLKTGFTLFLRRELKGGLYDVILTTERAPTEGGVVLLKRKLVWMGHPQSQCYQTGQVPLAMSYNCMFRKPAVDALDAAGLDWIDVTQSMNDQAAMVCAAADMGIRAELGFGNLSGLAPIRHDGRLPELPEYCVVMYFSPGLDKDIAESIGEVMRSAFSADNKPLQLSAESH